jgi:hypothetical protein
MPEVAKDIFGEKYLFACFSEELMDQNNYSFSGAFSLQKFVF